MNTIKTQLARLCFITVLSLSLISCRDEEDILTPGEAVGIALQNYINERNVSTIRIFVNDSFERETESFRVEGNFFISGITYYNLNQLIYYGPSFDRDEEDNIILDIYFN
ncbi:MAG: hypothetical protein ACFB0B_18415 [Thermonemataceae bacterium]